MCKDIKVKKAHLLDLIKDLDLKSDAVGLVGLVVNDWAFGYHLQEQLFQIFRQ